MSAELYRDFDKLILAMKLHEEVTLWSSKVIGIQSSSDGTSKFKILLNATLTPSEDIALAGIVSAHVPSSSFLIEKDLTDSRNKEGFDLYKKIFAHISDNDAVSNIDGFIAISDYIHKLRNFLKDGNFETAVRYMFKYVLPLNAFSSQELYRTWIREIALKYNPALDFEIPALAGTPLEGTKGIDYIEIAESV